MPTDDLDAASRRLAKFDPAGFFRWLLGADAAAELEPLDGPAPPWAAVAESRA